MAYSGLGITLPRVRSAGACVASVLKGIIRLYLPFAEIAGFYAAALLR